MSDFKTDLADLRWKDSAGRSWGTFIDIPLAEYLRSRGWDFVDHEAFAKRIGDPYQAADFASDLHRGQFERAEMTELQFLGVMTEEEGRFRSVLDASIAGVVDFLRRRLDLLRAGLIAQAWQGTKDANASLSKKLESSKVGEAINAELERTGQKFDKVLDQIISGERSVSSLANTAAASQELGPDSSKK